MISSWLTSARRASIWFRRTIRLMPEVVGNMHQTLLMGIGVLLEIGAVAEQHQPGRMATQDVAATLLLMSVVAGGIGGLRPIAFARTPSAAKTAGGHA